MMIKFLKNLFFPSTGAWAERKAAAYLKHCGLKILQRNYRSHKSEIDIIAQDKKQLVFIEVRARNTHAKVPGAQTLDSHKRGMLRRGVNGYLRGLQGEVAWRFDIVEVSYENRKKFTIYHYPCSHL